MPKKGVTKKDPRKELSPYLNHQEQVKNRGKQKKVSASLTNLQAERRRSLRRRMSIFVIIAIVMILALGYYISPLANIADIEVSGASDLSPTQIAKKSGIQADDKVISQLFNQNEISERVKKAYPEIKSVKVAVKEINHVVLKVSERETVGYVKTGSSYRKLLTNGRLGKQHLKWDVVDHDKPLYLGFSKRSVLDRNFKLFQALPASFRSQVKLISGNTKRSTQVIYIMKDGNVVIGNIDTFKQKVHYYDAIRAKADKHSLIDMEIGAFSRKLTSKERKMYGV